MHFFNIKAYSSDINLMPELYSYLKETKLVDIINDKELFTEWYLNYLKQRPKALSYSSKSKKSKPPYHSGYGYLNQTNPYHATTTWYVGSPEAITTIDTNGSEPATLDQNFNTNINIVTSSPGGINMITGGAGGSGGAGIQFITPPPSSPYYTNDSFAQHYAERLHELIPDGVNLINNVHFRVDPIDYEKWKSVGEWNTNPYDYQYLDILFTFKKDFDLKFAEGINFEQLKGEWSSTRFTESVPDIDWTYYFFNAMFEDDWEVKFLNKLVKRNSVIMGSLLNITPLKTIHIQVNKSPIVLHNYPIATIVANNNDTYESVFSLVEETIKEVVGEEAEEIERSGTSSRRNKSFETRKPTTQERIKETKNYESPSSGFGGSDVTDERRARIRSVLDSLLHSTSTTPSGSMY